MGDVARRCLTRYYELFVVKFNERGKVEAWAHRGKRRQSGDGLIVPMVMWGGKHRSLMKTMLASWDEETVVALLEEFFSTSDPAVTSCDYSVDQFYFKAQRLLTSRRRLSSRLTAHNVHAADQAIQGRS